MNRVLPLEWAKAFARPLAAVRPRLPVLAGPALLAPVKFVGLGEKASDLAVFNADQFVDALFADAA